MGQQWDGQTRDVLVPDRRSAKGVVGSLVPAFSCMQLHDASSTVGF